LGIGLVARIQFSLGDLLVALGFLFADVLGVVLQGVAALLRHLVVGRDAVLGSGVLGLVHGHAGGGNETGQRQGYEVAGEIHAHLLGRSVVEAEIRVAAVPVLALLLGSVAGQAFAFLELADELLALAVDHVQVVVGELAPLFLHGELVPISLYA